MAASILAMSRWTLAMRSIKASFSSACTTSVLPSCNWKASDVGDSATGMLQVDGDPVNTCRELNDRGLLCRRP